MPIVVTGAAGFIGAHLVEALCAEGEDVVAIDRLRGSSADGCSWVTADLLGGDDAVQDALDGADIVYHLAGRPGVRCTDVDIARQRHRDNTLATQFLAEHTPLATPVVVSSSSSVYGGTSGAPCREDGPVAPRGGYARGKLAAERACAARAARGGRVSVLRLFTVAGERQRPDMALSIWISSLLAGRPVYVHGGVERSRDVTDVRDVVAVLQRVGQLSPPGVLNVGTGRAHTIGQMISAVERATGVTAVVRVIEADPQDPAATLADTTRLRQIVGVVPHTDLDRLVRRQVAAFVATPVKPTAVKEPV